MDHRTPGFVRASIAIGLPAVAVITLVMAAACRSAPPDLTPQEKLIAEGRDLFFEETFGGNGRTCGSCHPATNNFTIDAGFIARLPDENPLFVAETDANLRQNFENPRLMRQFGLILENLDGFEDLENKFTQRGVPHTLALGTSSDSPQGPRLGWSGDGSPADGTLRSFAIGAVIQHFTRTLNRIPGVDLRLPTVGELDALAAFQSSLGREQDLQLPVPLTGVQAKRGQQIFLDDQLGKCNICHGNAGANARPGGNNLGNANFDTGVETLPDQPIDQIGEKVPPDDGFRTPGNGTFNTPPLVEAADTGPFFHNNSIETIEGAVAFYSGSAFNNSASGRFLARTDPNGIGIRLDATQTVAVAAFLRVINALENIRLSEEILEGGSLAFAKHGERDRQLQVARAEIEDAVDVLAQANLHPQAVVHLKEAMRLTRRAQKSVFRKDGFARKAVSSLHEARQLMVESQGSSPT